MSYHSDTQIHQTGLSYSTDCNNTKCYYSLLQVSSIPFVCSVLRPYAQPNMHVVFRWHPESCGGNSGAFTFAPLFVFLNLQHPSPETAPHSLTAKEWMGCMEEVIYRIHALCVQGMQCHACLHSLFDTFSPSPFSLLSLSLYQQSPAGQRKRGNGIKEPPCIL